MATRHTFGEADDPAVEGTAVMAKARPGNRNGRGGGDPSGVVRRACDDSANGVIQGDLVGSRAFRGDDDVHAMRVAGGPGVARSSDRPGRVGEP